MVRARELVTRRTWCFGLLVQLIACHGVSEREHRRGSGNVADVGPGGAGGSGGGNGSATAGESGMDGGGSNGGGGAAGNACTQDEPCVLDNPCQQGVTDCSTGEPICVMNGSELLAPGASCGEELQCTSDGECVPDYVYCAEAGSSVVDCGLIAAGDSHVCALRTQGRVKCWGSNTFGQVGHGDNGSASSRDRGDEEGEMGEALPFVDLGTNERAKQVVAGSHFSCALLESGQVRCWGLNESGQLGVGDIDNRGDEPGEMGDELPYVRLPAERIAVSLTACGEQACALLDNAQISCWGANFFGGMGTGNTDPLGTTDADLPIVDLGSHTVKAVSAGGSNCVILEDDSVSCWGKNNYGSAGMGDTESRGDEPGEMGDNIPILSLGDGRSAKKLFASGGHTCVLFDNDELKCWGFNGYGALGRGNKQHYGDDSGEVPAAPALSAIPLGTSPLRHAASLPVGGSESMCAILDDGSLKCWGANQSGQLGQGDVDNRGDDPGEMGNLLLPIPLGSPNPTVLAVTTGLHTVCVVLSNGDVKSWGSNDSGQLGRGDKENIGDESVEMGEHLLPVDLGSQ